MHMHRICEISQIVTNILDTPCIHCVKNFWYLYTLRILKSLEVLVKLKLWKMIQYTSTQAHLTASHFRITSLMRSTVSGCQVTYIMTTLLVLEIFKMDGYSPDRRHMYVKSAQDQNSSLGPCFQG